MSGLENISKVNLGNSNAPGLFLEVYECEAHHVSGVNYPENPANYRDACKVAFANLVFYGPLVKISTTDLRGKLDGELISPDVDGQFKKHMLSFSLAGTRDEVLGYDRQSNNAKKIFFVQEKNNGTIRIFGNNTWPAHKTASADTTGDDSTKRGIDMTWESYGHGPALILDGSISDLEGLLGYSGSASASY